MSEPAIIQPAAAFDRLVALVRQVRDLATSLNDEDMGRLRRAGADYFRDCDHAAGERGVSKNRELSVDIWRGLTAQRQEAIDGVLRAVTPLMRQIDQELADLRVGGDPEPSHLRSAYEGLHAIAREWAEYVRLLSIGDTTDDMRRVFFTEGYIAAQHGLAVV